MHTLITHHYGLTADERRFACRVTVDALHLLTDALDGEIAISRSPSGFIAELLADGLAVRLTTS